MSTVAESSSVPAAAPAASPTDLQKAFWQESLSTHGSSLLQTMLLHDDEAEADAMNKGEIEEIFAMCRIQKDWIVCEWAAGMGRLTPLLSEQSRFVYSSDFVQSFCDANAARCAEMQLRNVQVDCIDAAEYAPTSESRPPFQTNAFDLVFVNWLLLYLDDAHAEKFLRAATSSCRKQITSSSPQPPPPAASAASAASASNATNSSSGLIFLHESCWERSREAEWFASLPSAEQSRLLSISNEKTEECQTYYRTAYWYETLFTRCGLEIVEKRELSVYKNFGVEEAQATAVVAAVATAAPAADDAPAAVKPTGASAAPLVIENDHYNKQMCWLLRIRQ